MGMSALLSPWWHGGLPWGWVAASDRDLLHAQRALGREGVGDHAVGDVESDGGARGVLVPHVGVEADELRNSPGARRWPGVSLHEQKGSENDCALNLPCPSFLPLLDPQPYYCTHSTRPA